MCCKTKCILCRWLILPIEEMNKNIVFSKYFIMVSNFFSLSLSDFKRKVLTKRHSSIKSQISDISDLEYTAADGTKWTESNHFGQGKLKSHNILREIPGPTSYAKRNIIHDSATSAWRLLIDNRIMDHIITCTLSEAKRCNDLKFTLSQKDLEGFLAISYARGIFGRTGSHIYELWDKKWGLAICKDIMGRNRFTDILKYLRFDEKNTRSSRLKTDKFALFSFVWDKFIENSSSCYKPGSNITIDEQLFPSKARCPFTQYISTKSVV